jgi:putative ABC transport system permease protein
MRRIALKSLFHNRGKLIAALAGVTFATTLAFVQFGLYRGFEGMASQMIERIGGDVWVMPRDIEVIDYGEPLAVAVRNRLLSHRCVAEARAVVFGFAWMRKPNGRRDFAIVIGSEGWARPPWGETGAVAAELAFPNRLTVDRSNLAKLQLPAAAEGVAFEVSGHEATVVAVTSGLRSITLSPIFIASVASARRFALLGETGAHYYSVVSADEACTGELLAWAKAQHDLQALTSADWAAKTADYWVHGSGAGAALLFGAVFGLLVGAIIVGQTLYSMIKDYRRELATLKALGSGRGELTRFVAWQVGLLALVGGTAGCALAFLVAEGGDAIGLEIHMTGGVLLLGAGAVVLMCLLASLGSLRALFNVAATEVFQ